MAWRTRKWFLNTFYESRRFSNPSYKVIFIPAGDFIEELAEKKTKTKKKCNKIRIEKVSKSIKVGAAWHQDAAAGLVRATRRGEMQRAW